MKVPELLLLVTATLAVTSIVASGSLRGIPTKCPLIDSIDKTVHLPHEYDCTKYYKCSNGKRHLQDCPVYRRGHKLYYDPERQICNWPWSVTCWSQRVECRTDQLIEPHPYNCNSYYKCEDGKRILKTCDKGELFDSELMTCLPEENANCNIYLDRCPSGEIFGSVRLPHECKCSAYYECANGEFIEKYCPLGKEFDVNLRECVLAKEAVCYTDSGPLPHPIKCPPSGTKNISHAANCSLYYECVNGFGNEKKCDDGLSFVEEKGMCTWPPSSDCSSKLYSHQSNVAVLFAFDKNNETDDFVCPSNGSKEMALLPHHCSCTKYYVCMDGEKVLENCPDGMEYDYVRQVCDYPENALCRNRKSKAVVASLKRVASRRECSRNGNERIPHEYKCRWYYQCQRGVKYLRSCYEGHYFNDIIQACDLPINTNCVEGATSTTRPENPFECPLLDCDGIIRLPNRGNCSLYYKCENGEKVPKACPSGLYFDSEEQICDWPENVKCIPKKMCATGEKIHHECQCNLYYLCQNGQQVLQRCPNGENFDYKKKVCDKSENVICYSGKADYNDDQCIGKCSTDDSTENLPHEDCRKYCKCSGGISHAVECPINKFYNSAKQECDSPENVPNLNCDPFPCQPDSTSEKLPHTCYCDRYYVCRNGLKHREICDDGLYFDYVKRACVEAGQARCFANEPIQETEDEKKCRFTCSSHTSQNSFGHKDCKKYCMCNNGRRKVYKCPEGLFFDTEKGKCNWPENIKRLGCNPFPCVRNSVNIPIMLPHECNCSLYYNCYNGSKYREACADGYHFDYVEQSCIKSKKVHCYKSPLGTEAVAAEDCIGSCPEMDSTNANILLPHEQCTKFCVCQSGAPYVVTCPDGLQYNKLRGICTTPDAAQCER